jgi:anti-sigma28 factor (negative regulator of flagellin synthesis)
MSKDDMVDARKAHVEHLHEHVKDGYEVDPAAVAEAILRRLLEGRVLASAPAGD